MKIIKQFPSGENIVGMVAYQGNIIVATTKRVFMLIDDKLIPIEFKTAVAVLETKV